MNTREDVLRWMQRMDSNGEFPNDASDAELLEVLARWTEDAQGGRMADTCRRAASIIQNESIKSPRPATTRTGDRMEDTQATTPGVRRPL